jgi:hypothetical protein
MGSVLSCNVTSSEFDVPDVMLGRPSRLACRMHDARQSLSHDQSLGVYVVSSNMNPEGSPRRLTV